MRRSFSGWPRLVKVGYRRMKEKRGLQAAAKREINVRNRRELEHLSSEKHVVRIAHTVGERKRREILVKATEMGLKVIASRRLLPTSTGQVVAEEDSKPKAHEAEKMEDEAGEGTR